VEVERERERGGREGRETGEREKEKGGRERRETGERERKRKREKEGEGKAVRTFKAEQRSSLIIKVKVASLMNTISPLSLLIGGCVPVVSTYLFLRQITYKRKEKKRKEKKRKEKKRKEKKRKEKQIRVKREKEKCYKNSHSGDKSVYSLIAFHTF
jgi:flagellar biosynthesis component FlhA